MSGRIIFFLLLCSLNLSAEQLAVAYGQTIRVAAPGATAAFSFNDLYVEVRAEAGIVTVFGKNAGSATIVIVSDLGTRTLEVHVIAPDPSYPPGFVSPASAEAGQENDSYELRFTSNPSQLQNIADFQRAEGNRWVRFHVAGSFEFSDFSNRSIFALGSAFYQVSTPARDVTLLDQLVGNSPLTVDRSIVRGFHYRQGTFFFHAGYTSSTTFAFAKGRRRGGWIPVFRGTACLLHAEPLLFFRKKRVRYFCHQRLGGFPGLCLRTFKEYRLIAGNRIQPRARRGGRVPRVQGT